MRIVALGNPDRGDDGAALAVAERLQEETTVILAGRPGPQLLDLLSEDDPCILLDVTWSGAPPGTLVQIPLAELTPGLLPDLRVSSHGFGPGETLALARALGRRLPSGVFLGIEGESYEPGAGLSPAVMARMPELEDRVRESKGEIDGGPDHPPPVPKIGWFHQDRSPSRGGKLAPTPRPHTQPGDLHRSTVVPVRE